MNGKRVSHVFICIIYVNMPEATYISLSLRAASVWLRHLASGLRPSLLLNESEQIQTKLPL